MLVTSDDLRPLGAAATPYAPDTPRPGWAEQAPELWDGALGVTIGKALEAADCEVGEVGALGVAGQLVGCAALGADGRALGPCLIWMDRRAHGAGGPALAASVLPRRGAPRARDAQPIHLPGLGRR